MLRDDIRSAQAHLKRALESLDENISLDAMHRLLEACRTIEDQYMDFCEEMDDAFHEDRGTTYKQGINIEFYIEASDWHEISLALRQLEEKVEKDDIQ